MSTWEEKRKEHLDRNCVFCKWFEDPDWDKSLERGKDRYRLIEANKDKGYVVVLSLEPKTAGHTLVVSVDPYDDISDSSKSNPKFKIEDLLLAVVRYSRKIQEKMHATKVYVYTMCDHFQPWEIDPDYLKTKIHPETTEHLHFHLLPRYEGAPKGESLFCLPDKKAGIDWEATPAGMKTMADSLRPEDVR